MRGPLYKLSPPGAAGETLPAATRLRLNYEICSRSMARNNAAIATAGKTSPTKGTKIEGRKTFSILNFFAGNFVLSAGTTGPHF